MLLQEYGFEHGSKAPLRFFIKEYHLDILPLDSDLISLYIPTAFKVCGIEVATALTSLSP